MTESFIEIESGHYITETLSQKFDVQGICWEIKKTAKENN